MNNFIHNVEADILERNLIPVGSSVLVAVSGGADSVALLLTLANLAGKHGWKVAAAHYDHAMRSDSASDTEFVARLCTALGIRFSTGRSSNLTHDSSEDKARRERLTFLHAAAAEQGCSMIATGHTAGDRAETVIMNIARGAGLSGIAGIRWMNGTFVRPLLGRSRREVEEFLTHLGQPWCEDSTNASFDYTRNRIRHSVIPALQEHVNPRAIAAICRLADLAAADDDYLQSAAVGVFNAAKLCGDAGEVRLASGVLRETSPPLANRAIRLAIQALLGDMQDVSAEMVERVLEKVGNQSSATDIGLLISVQSSPDIVTLRTPVRPVVDFDYDLPLDGIVEIPEADARIALGDASSMLQGLSACLSIPHGRLHARNWRAGDRMRPKGLNGTKKLQDIFVDAKASSRHRRILPLVCANDEIIWVPGLAIAEASSSIRKITVTLEANWYPQI